MQVVILYNEPVLDRSDREFASEAGALDSVRALSESLRERGHSVPPVGVHGPAASPCESRAAIRALVVVNLVEGFAGRSRHEPHVAACLELLGLPYTGSPPECLALVHDKAR